MLRKLHELQRVATTTVIPVLLLSVVAGCSSTPTDPQGAESRPALESSDDAWLRGHGVLEEPDDRSTPSVILNHTYDGHLFDSSGYRHRTTALGNPGFGPSCLGLALALDGVNDVVLVAADEVLQPEAVTVEVLFKPAHTLTNGTIFEPIVVKLPEPFDFGTSVDGFDIAYQDPWGTGGRIGFGIGSQDGRLRQHASAYVTMSADRFHYVVGTYDGSQIRLYIDGQIAATSDFDQPIAYLGGPIHIGGLIGHSLILPGQGPQYFEGEIDFVTIHSTALSPETIARRAAHLAFLCGGA